MCTSAQLFPLYHLEVLAILVIYVCVETSSQSLTDSCIGKQWLHSLGSEWFVFPRFQTFTQSITNYISYVC